jgi:hypothetical protein
MTLRVLIEELIGAWQVNDAYRASAFFASEGVYHESGREPIVGRAAIFEQFSRFFRDGPPWRLEIEEIIVEGEHAAVAYRFEIKAGGIWRASAGCALVACEGGLISRWREYHG